MEILINETSYRIEESSTLLYAMELIDIKSQSGIAIAVNNKVIPKPKWESYVLAPSDRIIVIKVAQGG